MVKDRSVGKSLLLKVSLGISVLVGWIIFPSCNVENLQGEIVIENNSPYQVVEFYVTLEDSEDWGEDLLDTPIEPGETRTIPSLPREEIKAKAVFLGETGTFDNIRHNLNLLLNSKLTLELQA